MPWKPRNEAIAERNPFPVGRDQAVERVGGVSRHHLRPDIYPALLEAYAEDSVVHPSI